MTTKNTTTIRIEAYSWIAGALGQSESQNRKLKKSLPEGSTAYDLFSALAAENDEFRKQVFDPDKGELSDQVMIIMNGRLLQSADLKQTCLNDNDKVTLSPVLVGG